MQLDLTQRLAVKVIGWGLLAVLSFFFHAVAFLIPLFILFVRVSEFTFLYQNTKAVKYDSDIHPDGVTTTDGAELGTNGQGSLRENLPESKG